MSASEARRRLERFRARVKAEEQAKAAARDSVVRVCVWRGGGEGRGRGPCEVVEGDENICTCVRQDGRRGRRPTGSCSRSVECRTCIAVRACSPTDDPGKSLHSPSRAVSPPPGLPVQAGDKVREAEEEAIKVAFEGAVSGGLEAGADMG